MIRWKTLTIELVILGTAVLAVYMHAHSADPLALWHQMGKTPVTAPVTHPYQPPSNRFEDNRSAATVNVPTPPKEIASPIPTHRRTTPRRAMKPIRRRATKPPYWAPQHIPQRDLGLRRGSSFCKQIPAIAYHLDRETLIAAMNSRGVDAATEAKVLACLGK